MKTLNVELPGYVWTDLKIRAAQQTTSMRHVVMTALRKDGLAIREADMIDANVRRMPGRLKSANQGRDRSASAVPQEKCDWAKSWSGRRESNPRMQLGKLYVSQLGQRDSCKTGQKSPYTHQ
jgi:hypothetical protein